MWLVMMTKTFVYLQSLVVCLRDRESGQTMAEYAVVLAVITIGIVVALTALGTGIRSTLGNVTSKL
jgi:Flp pilus assembly pilin Flp